MRRVQLRHTKVFGLEKNNSPVIALAQLKQVTEHPLRSKKNTFFCMNISPLSKTRDLIKILPTQWMRSFNVSVLSEIILANVYESFKVRFTSK